MRHDTNMDCNNAIRVLHVVDILSPSSGVASVIMNYVRGIKSVVQDIAVYGECDGGMKSVVEMNGGIVHRLPDVALSFGRSFQKNFSDLLKKQQYKIVHGHLMNSAFIYMKEAKRRGIPHRIIHAHSTQMSDTTIKRIRNKILSIGIPLWANNYIAVSSAAAKQSFGKNCDARIVSNGIDTNLFRYNKDMRTQVRRELNIPENTVCVGHVARFSPIKNHEFLIDVYEILRMHIDCILVLVGDGPLEGAIKNKVRDMGLQDSVKFLGLRQDAHRLYQAFDVFLLPSVSEGFGSAAVEAQCAGLGCLVSNSVPKTVICSDNIKFLPTTDAKIWANETMRISKILRIDGSSGVKEAKLDSISMCVKINQAYKTMLRSAV